MQQEAPTPFSPFDPAKPAAEAPEPLKNGRRKRTKKTTKRVTKVAAAEPAKRTRKPRQPRPATVPVELLVVASGLDERAAQVFAGVVQALAGLRKPARRKLVEALQKLS